VQRNREKSARQLSVSRLSLVLFGGNHVEMAPAAPEPKQNPVVDPTFPAS